MLLVIYKETHNWVRDNILTHRDQARLHHRRVEAAVHHRVPTSKPSECFVVGTMC